MTLRPRRTKKRSSPSKFNPNSISLYGGKNPNFNFENCNFTIHKVKETCGRVVMWKEFNLVNSFTLECSF